MLAVANTVPMRLRIMGCLGVSHDSHVEDRYHRIGGSSRSDPQRSDARHQVSPLGRHCGWQWAHQAHAPPSDRACPWAMRDQEWSVGH